MSKEGKDRKDVWEGAPGITIRVRSFSNNRKTVKITTKGRTVPQEMLESFPVFMLPAVIIRDVII